ncbi:unnamed protein product [Gordionus sp. m RMFG-2023]
MAFLCESCDCTILEIYLSMRASHRHDSSGLTINRSLFAPLSIQEVGYSPPLRQSLALTSPTIETSHIETTISRTSYHEQLFDGMRIHSTPTSFH